MVWGLYDSGPGLRAEVFRLRQEFFRVVLRCSFPRFLQDVFPAPAEGFFLCCSKERRKEKSFLVRRSALSPSPAGALAEVAAAEFKRMLRLLCDSASLAGPERDRL